jgi:hypothetical protein
MAGCGTHPDLSAATKEGTPGALKEGRIKSSFHNSSFLVFISKKSLILILKIKKSSDYVFHEVELF